MGGDQPPVAKHRGSTGRRRLSEPYWHVVNPHEEEKGGRLLLTTLLDLRPGYTDAHADVPGGIGHVALRRQPRRSGGDVAERTTV